MDQKRMDDDLLDMAKKALIIRAKLEIPSEQDILSLRSMAESRGGSPTEDDNLVYLDCLFQDAGQAMAFVLHACDEMDGVMFRVYNPGKPKFVEWGSGE